MLVTDENGNQVEAVLASDHENQIAQTKKEADDARAEALAAKTEAENLRKVTAEKTENFKKLNEMSEKEKEAYSAKELENMKRVEAAEARAKVLEEKFNEGENNRIKTDKEKALFKYHGGNKDLKEALEKNFDLINLVGNSTEIIEERAKLAANMEKGKMATTNPLYAHLSGDAPRNVVKNDKDKFMESDKAKKALELMGDKPAK